MVKEAGKKEGKSHYARVQLKEIVPPHINPNATIESELAKLGKYQTSSQTLVAVHINQEARRAWILQLDIQASSDLQF